MDFFDEHFKMLMVKSICNAVSHDMPEDRMRRDFVTDNQPWSRMWNHLNTNIKEAFENDDVDIYPAKRGPWQFILIYCPKTKVVLTIMSEDRLCELQRKCSRENIHYLDALLQRLNKDIMGEQLEFDLSGIRKEYSEEEIDKVLSKICPVIKENAKRHVLITFNRNGDIVLSVMAKMLAAVDLSVSEKEDWSKYIGTTYEVVANSGKTTTPIKQEIPLPLTDKAKEKLRKKTIDKHKDLKKDEPNEGKNNKQ